MFQDYSDSSVAASFAMHGGLIKEVVEDLGWPNAPVVISVSRRPPMLALKASGDTGGELEVQLDLETRDLEMGVNWEMDRDVEHVSFRCGAGRPHRCSPASAKVGGLTARARRPAPGPAGTSTSTSPRPCATSRRSTPAGSCARASRSTRRAS